MIMDDLIPEEDWRVQLVRWPYPEPSSRLRARMLTLSRTGAEPTNEAGTLRPCFPPSSRPSMRRLAPRLAEASTNHRRAGLQLPHPAHRGHLARAVGAVRLPSPALCARNADDERAASSSTSLASRSVSGLPRTEWRVEEGRVVLHRSRISCIVQRALLFSKRAFRDGRAAAAMKVSSFESLGLLHLASPLMRHAGPRPGLCSLERLRDVLSALYRLAAMCLAVPRDLCHPRPASSRLIYKQQSFSRSLQFFAFSLLQHPFSLLSLCAPTLISLADLDNPPPRQTRSSSRSRTTHITTPTSNIQHVDGDPAKAHRAALLRQDHQESLP